MMREFRFNASDGIRLFGRIWEVDAPKAVVCIIHGLGEHSGRYEHVAIRMNENGIAVASFDLRGHGKSDGKRGDADYDSLMSDISVFLSEVADEFRNAPLFLYGHSLGGNLVLNYVLRKAGRTKMEGVISTGPFLRLTKEPSPLIILLAKLLNVLHPSVTLSNGLNPADLSHDERVVKAYIEDPLVHDRISARLFLGSYNAGKWALENAHNFDEDLLLMHGGDDKITSPQASREFAEKAKKCTLKIWDGMYHEIHNELGWEEVVNYTIDWIKMRIE